jgi:hypothetical protein
MKFYLWKKRNIYHQNYSVLENSKEEIGATSTYISHRYKNGAFQTIY